MLYRSTELDKLQGDDLSAAAAPGLRTVVDLRTTDERSAQPDQLPHGVQLVFDVLKDSKGAAPAQLLQVLRDPESPEELFGGGKAAKLFERAYR